MPNLQCIGNFTYTSKSVVAIVKMIESNNHTFFTNGNHYPIIYNMTEKTYEILDDMYNLSLGLYASDTIEGVLRELHRSNECIFDVSYYINYTIFDKKFIGQPTFCIDWSLKKFDIKIKSKFIKL